MLSAIAGIVFDADRIAAGFRLARMIRWLIVVFVALIVFNSIGGWLEKIGLGRLPGDFRFRLFGREWFIPLASSVLITLIAVAIGHFV